MSTEFIRKIDPSPVISLPSNVGNYKNTVAPIILLIVNLVFMWLATDHFTPDTRKTFFMADSVFYPVIIPLLYILGCQVWGPRMMVGRTPYSLKSFLPIYNVTQVILSFYQFMEVRYTAMIKLL